MSRAARTLDYATINDKEIDEYRVERRTALIKRGCAMDEREEGFYWVVLGRNQPEIA